MSIFASMKRVFLLIISIILLSNQSLWAISIDSLFVNLRIPELSLLSTNNKLDLLDYYNCGQVANVENAYLGRTILTSKTSNTLQLETTKVNTIEIMVLTREQGDSIVGVISTINEPVEMSQLQFYTLEGTPLNVNFTLPSVESFLGNASLQVKWNKLIPKLQVKATYLSEEKQLICSLSLKGLTLEEQQDLKLPMQQVCYKWNGLTFVQV